VIRLLRLLRWLRWLVVLALVVALSLACAWNILPARPCGALIAQSNPAIGRYCHAR
jgi:hypothetical protein